MRAIVFPWILALLSAATLRAEPVVPPGFETTRIVDGIDAATALTIAPDGRIFIAEQTGRILVIRDGERLSEPALDLSERLDTWWERGLIGMTLHPDFPRTPHLFVVYVAAEPHTHHVVSRFTVIGNRVDPASEMVLLTTADQEEFGAKIRGGHQGGPIVFGADGNLFIGLGELTANQPSQSMDTLYGKILRIRPDGGIPEDNPYFDQVEGKMRAIYATGIRNPFGLAVDPQSGDLFHTDVGGRAFEEINRIVAGGNYGWPQAEGFSEKPGLENPLHAYPPAIGRSICGAMVYPRGGSFPEEWHGRLFFVDWASHWIKAIDPASPDTLIPFATGFEAPVAIASAPDGSVYVLNRNTRWRDGKQFKSEVGSLVRIRHLGADAPPAVPSPHPATLTGHQVFEDVARLAVAEDFVPLHLNAAPWRPGVRVSRWIRLPESGRIDADPEADWRFPAQTTVIEHFDTESTPSLRHETHVHISNGDGTWRAAAYRWAPDSADDATLIAMTDIVSLPGGTDLRWVSPGPEAALAPELAIVGFLLPLNARQLHHGSQLSEWIERGWLSDPPGETALTKWPRLAPLDDEAASLEHRVRSYLDANCANCHRPGGPSRGFFDARFTTPLAEQGLLDGPLMAGDLGVEDSRVVVAGDLDRSALLRRMRDGEVLRMPPVAVNDLPSPLLPLLESWILELAKP